jgi:hypothetical protein
MKSLNLLLPAILLVPLSFALADDNANSHTSTTDANGTTVTTDSSHKDSVGLTGTKKSVTDKSTVVDPKGLMNKKTAKLHSETKVKPNGDYAESNTLKDENGTEEVETAQKKTSKHWTDNGQTTTVTKTHSVDPEGLGNKEKKVITKKVDTNPDGTKKVTVTKKVNGDTVSDETSVTR